jgi:GTP-binding protein LepA
MITGFEDVKPMVLRVFIPVDTEDYEELRFDEKLQLNDASLVLPESSAALGFGFVVDFRMLHMEIIQER